MASNGNSQSCYGNWMVRQREDLALLTQALTQHPHDTDALRRLVETTVAHFDEYHRQRLAYSSSNAGSFFSPKWCNPNEKTYLWLAGCRPSLFIRIIYTLCGLSIEVHLQEILQGMRAEYLGLLSVQQLASIDELQLRTIHSEDDMSNRAARMQEAMGNPAFVKMTNAAYEGQNDEFDVERQVFDALDSMELGWSSLLEEADTLRINTLREIVGILTPLQSVELLVAGKRLHLCMSKWCNQRESQQ